MLAQANEDRNTNYSSSIDLFKLSFYQIKSDTKWFVMKEQSRVEGYGRILNEAYGRLQISGFETTIVLLGAEHLDH